MATKRKGNATSVYLGDEENEIIEKKVAEGAKSKSAVIQEALKQYGKSDEEVKKPTVIVVSNYKGGAGKTTTTSNLAYCLARRDNAVLAIDIDGQVNLTNKFGITEAFTDVNFLSIADVMLTPYQGKRKALEDIIIDVEVEDGIHIDLAPSSFNYSDPDVRLQLEQSAGADIRLRNALNKLMETKSYDYILIDCPPSTGMNITNAITALDCGNAKSFCLIPMEPAFDALLGAQKTVDMIRQISEDRGLPMPRYKTLWTKMFAKRRAVDQFKDLYFKNFDGSELLKTTIRNDTKVAESGNFLQVVSVYAKNTNAAQDYNALAIEIEAYVHE